MPSIKITAYAPHIVVCVLHLRIESLASTTCVQVMSGVGVNTLNKQNT